MTDDPTTPNPADPTTPNPADVTDPEATTAPTDAGEQRRFADARRRRRLVVAAVAGGIVLVLLLGGCLAALAVGIGRVVRNSEHAERTRDRVASACGDLERRLNRLTPPGATSGARQRAAAIRDENAAIRPFLADIERLPGRRHEDADDRRDTHADLWRRLVDARVAYADALDRQANGGEPAFFITPTDRHGRPVVDLLQRGPQSCAAAARRLAAPDL